MSLHGERTTSRWRKPLPALFVAVLVGLLIAACGDDSNGGSEASAGGGDGDVAGKKVTLLTVSQECEYCAIHTDAFKRVAEEAGLELDIKVNEFDAAEQAQQVNQAIAQKPDAIVIWPADANQVVPSLQRIKQANIPVVITNSLPLDAPEDLYDVYTGPNDIANGQEAARAMIQGFEEHGFGDSGRVVVVTGVPGTPPAIQRLEGFKEVLEQEAPGIEIVGEEPGNWDQTEATNAAAGLFTKAGKDIQGVYAEADNMLAGAIVAAKRRGLDPSELVMVGSNCSIEGVTNINKGTQYATVLQDPVLDGEYAANAVVDLLAGKEQEKKIYLPHPIITKENVSDCDDAIGK